LTILKSTRNTLRKMLLDSLSENTVVWDRKCTDLEVHDKKWIMSLKMGHSLPQILSSSPMEECRE
jgi:hypothetical protein